MSYILKKKGENNMRRRNLSGVYIFEQFEDEEKRQPTCFEDCTREKQEEWLNSLEPEALKNLCLHLGETLRGIGDKFGIYAGDESEE